MQGQGGLPVGSHVEPGWRNWQTRRIQNPLAERSCGFKSRPGHNQAKRRADRAEAQGAQMARPVIERRLSEIAERLLRLRTDLAVADEQMAHFSDEADDARVRALVSETALADREHRGADRHARAMERHRADILVEIERLESSQDDLLDKLAAGH